jgi:alpha,alpha-trehalase
MSLQIHETGSLFEQVQMQQIFPDGKTFPDCIAKTDLEKVVSEYQQQATQPGFRLKDFVDRYFNPPSSKAMDYQTNPDKTAEQHINELWDVLMRKPELEKSSIIPLPFPYIVPGGRFREIYYWDSYFTMLGLRVSGRTDVIKNMINNFSFLIDTIGFIPNGNRTYFTTRSQPPFFSLMIKLLSELEGEEVLLKYLPQLEKEYSFWMRGADALPNEGGAVHRVVKGEEGSLLNRYWDNTDTPRPESFKEDVELSHHSKQNSNELYRHLRAAAESGWDFSTRWFKDVTDFATIHTTDIIPVDLNCLLTHLEEVLSKAYSLKKDHSKSIYYSACANNRKAAIQKKCWNEAAGFYFDFDFVKGEQKEHRTLAALFPLFFKIASPAQAKGVAKPIEEQFLKPGGVTTTLTHSGQQWDAPNGWAPLQWICYRGLLNYGFTDLAGRIRKAWLHSNETVFLKTGKMTEKYDVWNSDAEASGGEYPNQDGFGWTNGVYLAMLKEK